MELGRRGVGGMNPADHGYYERRPGSGTWYRNGTERGAYEIKICRHEACGREFMARRRKKDSQRYCSP
jgi:hypothetical protein